MRMDRITRSHKSLDRVGITSIKAEISPFSAIAAASVKKAQSVKALKDKLTKRKYLASLP